MIHTSAELVDNHSTSTRVMIATGRTAMTGRRSQRCSLCLARQYLGAILLLYLHHLWIASNNDDLARGDLLLLVLIGRDEG